MNEKTLLLLCFAISSIILFAIRKRINKKVLVIGFLVLPFLIYAALLVLIVALALTYGDK